MSIERIQQTLDELNKFGSLDKGVTRLAYSQEECQAKEYFIQLCQKEGLNVYQDECGNIIARREGRHPSLPAVACGSHLDSVIEGGYYDGTIGVVGALEVIRRLNEKQIQTDHPLEIISFACEESSRFGVSTIGSKLMAGLIQTESLEELTDQNGISFPNALADCGYQFSEIEKAKRNKDELRLFLELHIEQGPTLESQKKKLGIVTGIASPTRLQVKIQGKASHSGTTMMNMRKDALLGASEIAMEVEKAAQDEAVHRTVATVGVFDVKPGAMNVVPGSVEMKIDVRSISYESKQRVIQKIIEKIENTMRKRHLVVNWKLLSDEQPIQLTQKVIESLVHVAKEQGIPYVLMPSGAGHDAMNMTHLCPTGLIFVPSQGGLSHHPDEYTSLKDIQLGIDILEETVLKWASISSNSSKYRCESREAL